MLRKLKLHNFRLRLLLNSTYLFITDLVAKYDAQRLLWDSLMSSTKLLIGFMIPCTLHIQIVVRY